MRIINSEEMQKLGGKLLGDSKLSFGDSTYVKGGSFPESSRSFILSMTEGYLNSGVDCLLMTSPGVITIWREEKKPEKQIPQPVAPVVVSTINVAYIDDSIIEAKIMGQIITELNYGFVHISNSMMAVAALLKSKPDIIFLDLNMPIVNGYEICAQLRRVPNFKETPIVIVTANDGLVDRVRAKMSGASEFVSKPIDRDKIGNVLEKYI